MGINVGSSVSGLVASDEMEQTLQMTLWSVNSEPIGFVKRGGLSSIPAIKLKMPIESWNDGPMRTELMAQFSEWREEALVGRAFQHAGI